MFLAVLLLLTSGGLALLGHGQNINTPENVKQLPQANYPLSSYGDMQLQEMVDTSTSVQGSKKSQVPTSYMPTTKHQHKMCGTMTILPLHDYDSCAKTINRITTAVCRNVRVKRQVLQPGGEEFEFDGKNWLQQDQQQQQLKRAINQAAAQTNNPPQWSHSEHLDVKQKLTKTCCKLSNICQVEFVVEMLSDACHPRDPYQFHVARARA